MRGAHDIGAPGLERVVVGGQNERLRGKVQDDVGPDLCHAGPDRIEVADVAKRMVDPVRKRQLVEKRGRGVGCKGQTGDPGAHPAQPERQP